MKTCWFALMFVLGCRGPAGPVGPPGPPGPAPTESTISATPTEEPVQRKEDTEVVHRPAPPASPRQAELAAQLSKEGEALAAAKKFSDASAKFREAVARSPEPRYFLSLCGSLYQEGKFGEALTACNATLVNNPSPELQRDAHAQMTKILDEAKRQNIDLTPP